MVNLPPGDDAAVAMESDTDDDDISIDDDGDGEVVVPVQVDVLAEAIEAVDLPPLPPEDFQQAVLDGHGLILHRLDQLHTKVDLLTDTMKKILQDLEELLVRVRA